MSEEPRQIKFFAGTFFATLGLNFLLFVFSFFLLLNGTFSALTINIVLFLLNMVANVVAYRAMSNRYQYRSFLYGQIIGFSLAGLLITLCGGLFNM